MTDNFPRLFSLEGKVALVTGATGYLGEIMCRALHEYGALVIGMSTGQKPCPESVEALYAVDFNDEEAVRAEAIRISTRYEPDILINNAHDMSQTAGFNVEGDHIEARSWSEWERHINTGIRIPSLLTSIVASRMKIGGGGSIINVCTMYAEVAPSPVLYAGTPYMNPPGYGASKAALLEFTKYVAAFWGRYGVRCNAVLPGPFPKNVSAMRRDFLGRLVDRTCLGRVGEGVEIAGPILFLASKASSYVTGHALRVDGGWTAI